MAIVVPPNAQLLDVSGLLDAFLEANRQSDGTVDYQLCLVAICQNKIVRASGASLIADVSIFDEDRYIDTLLLAGTPDYALAYESLDLHAWLRRRVPAARRCGSVGTGAFFLGAAGLLDGMTATTHWQCTTELAARCPAANILSDHIYVEDGALYTSAGVTAGIDLALKLIESDHGRDLARKVAHRLVASLQYPSGRSKGTNLTMRNFNEERIKAIQGWIVDHLSLDLTVEALAARTAMGVRHFTRTFRTETGTTPGSYVEMARVDAAKQLLEETDLLLQQVAVRCGFANSDVMRMAFRRQLGVKPSRYRQQFRA